VHSPSTAPSSQEPSPPETQPSNPAAAFDDPGETEDAADTAPWPYVVYEGPADWQIHRSCSTAHRTEAFADAPSYLPGDLLRLAVSTDSPTYTVDIFRVGATIQSVASSSRQKGIQQPKAHADGITKRITAPWRYTYSRRILTAWPSGLYLARVNGTGGSQAYTPFVVRSTRRSQILFVSNTLNNEAYNEWGGSSLYVTKVGEPAPGDTFAWAVSLDRPFDAEDGAGQLFTMEAPLIAWLEQQGYDVTYTTDYDLSLHPERQPLPAAVLFSGHSEYWGAGLRDWLDDHVNVRGDLGLGVFAADVGYWQVRFRDTSPTGPRTIELYKHSRLDPVARARCPDRLEDGASAFRSVPCGVRDPANRPEQALFGVQYEAIVPAPTTYQLGPGAASILDGTGLKAGDSLGRIAGGEVDQVDPTYDPPDGNLIVASTTCASKAGADVLAQAAMHRTSAGGRVFASGTFWWGWGLQPTYAAAHDVPKGFGRLTANIMAFLTKR
jgi:hypothetical protein